MLDFLLAEHISPIVADQLTARRIPCRIETVHRWRGGSLLGQRDEAVLRAAVEDGLTLVTYDVTTILPLLTEWGHLGLVHAGVIFFANRTIDSRDFGGLIRALQALQRREQSHDWRNRVAFLRPA